jgi:hypothetical protein
MKDCWQSAQKALEDARSKRSSWYVSTCQTQET